MSTVPSEPNKISDNNDNNDTEIKSKEDKTQSNKKYADLDEAQLSKEIKATKRRLLELIIRKNQLMVQKIKESQVQEQINSTNQQNNPQTPPFGQFNPFFFPKSFNGHHHHKDKKHKHSKKHSTKMPPFFELLQQRQQQQSQQQQSEYTPYSQNNFEPQYNPISQTQPRQFQSPSLNSQYNSSFAQNPHNYSSQPPINYQWYQCQQQEQQLDNQQQYSQLPFFPWGKVQGGPLFSLEKTKKSKNSKKKSKFHPLPPNFTSWQQQPWVQSNGSCQFGLSQIDVPNDRLKQNYGEKSNDEYSRIVFGDPDQQMKNEDIEPSKDIKNDEK